MEAIYMFYGNTNPHPMLAYPPGCSVAALQTFNAPKGKWCVYKLNYNKLTFFFHKKKKTIDEKSFYGIATLTELPSINWYLNVNKIKK